MKIILSDKQSAVRNVVSACLKDQGVSVIEAADSAQLIEKLTENHWDALWLDEELLDDALISFLSDLPRTKLRNALILTTFNDAPSITADFLKQVAPRTLRKPFSIEQLDNVISSLAPSKESKNSFETETGGEFISLSHLPSVKRHTVMKKSVALLQSVAQGDMTVIMTGESGVGKEIFARYLHAVSSRKDGKFIGINCASVPANLLEAELFGVEKGAYTGAQTRRIGKFEQAQGGILLLDEISEMDLNLQAKLLRVIQEKELYRVGGNERISLDVRLVVTSNRDLRDWVKQGKFREDLFYRLNVISVNIPPLRERVEDVPVLAQHFVDRFNKNTPDSHLELGMSAVEQLCGYDWPGNIRELENIMTRTAYLTRGNSVDKIFFDETRRESTPGAQLFNGTLDEMERLMIHKALEVSGGNRVRAADKLGISVRTLRNKLKLYREESRMSSPELDDGHAVKQAPSETTLSQ
jgi:DNA-binding NtrC family response regulator